MSKPPAMFRPLARYADFNGRSGRGEFWLFVLFVYLVTGAFAGAIYALSLKAGQFDLDTFLPAYLRYAPLFSLFHLIILIPYLAVAVRRLHDSNRTGWWLLLPMVISIVAYIVFFIVKGVEVVTILMNMAQQMAAQQTANPMMMINPVNVLKLEWPLFKLMLPWVLLPTLAAQILL